MTRAGLRARLGVRRGTFALDVDVDVRPGEVLAVLGPNGAGKTTVLRALAGLEPLGSGSVTLDGAVLDDPAAGTFVATRDRPVGMVFQDYLLFPHLDAVENVAFGLRARGTPRREARERARGWLERVGLAGQAALRPGALSGGQAQRVALARALATEPGLLLLDEPLAALDAATRLEVRTDLARHLAGYPGTTVLVTHDPVDAMVLADRLLVVEHGRAVQDGTPQQVARAPRTQYVARLVGLNLYRGHAAGTTVRLDGGATLSTATPLEGPVLLTFRPSAVALHTGRPQGSARNVWRGRVASLEHHGEVVRIRLDAEPPVLADVTTDAVADLGLRAGRDLWAAVKATEISAYPT